MDLSWLGDTNKPIRFWFKVTITGSGDGAAGTGSGGGAVGAGSGGGAAIEIGRHEVWETVFVGDEMIKYVDSSFCRKDCRRRFLCSFEGARVRDIEGSKG